MTIPVGVAQLVRGSVALLFPLLWMIEPPILLGASLSLAALAYVTGRAAVARGGAAALPLDDLVTPFGEGVMVAGAAALGIGVTQELHPLGWWGGAAIAAVVLVAHALLLPLLGRGAAELTARRRRVAAIAGLVGEVALSVALLTLAARALLATLAGPIAGPQLLLSPWPALLGMGLGFLPMVRLSLTEVARDEAKRRALEAAAVTLAGILLVGLGGPRWWP